MRNLKDLIESTYVLRNRLGHHFDIIKKLDPLPRERKLTSQIGRKLIKEYGQICGYCQKERKVEFAHIIPLEVGGTTNKENIILLCKKCHGLYDSGFLSIYAMQEIAKEWRAIKYPTSPRPPMDNIDRPAAAITPPPKSVKDVLEKVLILQSKRWYRQAINILKNELSNPQLNYTKRSYLLIKIAELNRRRSAHGVVKEALTILQTIKYEKLPPKYLPIYYYELGYVHRLTGNHSEAVKIFHQSAEASKGINQEDASTLGYIAASVNEILCSLAAKESLNRKEAMKLIDRLKRLEKMAVKNKKYWGGRWALNCVAHRLQICLKWGNKQESQKTLNEWRDRYFRSDLRSGWDAASKQSISLLEGLTRTIFPKNDVDLNIGISLLARSFITRLGFRQRPEGVRDVGFGLIKGIRRAKLNFPEDTMELIEKLMDRTIDGTSYLWPWRAPF